MWRRRVSQSRHQIRDVLNFAAPGPLLDIGCSLGYTIHAAQAVTAPLRWLSGQLRESARLRKEFCLVAVKPQSARS